VPRGRKPVQRPTPGLWDLQERTIGERRTFSFGIRAGPSRAALQRMEREFREATVPEPEQELEGSELSDAERHAAIARERARREGLI
jgi:hypothetical protein